MPIEDFKQNLAGASDDQIKMLAGILAHEQAEKERGGSVSQTIQNTEKTIKEVKAGPLGNLYPPIDPEKNVAETTPFEPYDIGTTTEDHRNRSKQNRQKMVDEADRSREGWLYHGFAPRRWVNNIRNIIRGRQ